MDIPQIVQSDPIFWLGRKHYLAFGTDPRLSSEAIAAKQAPHELLPTLESRRVAAGETFSSESLALLRTSSNTGFQNVQFADEHIRERVLNAQPQQKDSHPESLLLPAACSIVFTQPITLSISRAEPTTLTREATLKDVAALSGLSLKTVSRVINNEAFVAAETRSRALKAIGQLGYRRNAPAHNLRSGARKDTIGLITADLSNIFYAKITETVARICAEHNYRVITASSEEDPALERTIIEDMLERGVSGILFIPVGDGYDYLDPFLQQGLAFGSLDRPVPDKLIDSVVVENRAGTRQALEALLEQGHHRIGILLDALSIFTIQERYQGAREAFAQYQIHFPEYLLSTRVHSPEDAFAELERLMALPEPPTALFCGNNRALIGALRYLRATRTALPIISFEEFDLIDLFEDKVGLVDYSIAKLAGQATRHLLARIADPNRPVEQTVLTTELRLP